MTLLLLATVFGPAFFLGVMLESIARVVKYNMWSLAVEPNSKAFNLAVLPWLALAVLWAATMSYVLHEQFYFDEQISFLRSVVCGFLAINICTLGMMFRKSTWPWICRVVERVDLWSYIHLP